MKFAVVDGNRCEAQPKLRGQCPGCGSTVLAKCGSKKVWHWAHQGTRNCDRWWEPETEWHRAWKDVFPAEWQEVRHVAPDGEIHIADVKTEFGTVLEFQHSNITADERVSRERFYERMAWVVDGMRLKRDLPKFLDALVYARIANTELLQYLLPIRSAPIAERWVGGLCPVFVDFGDAEFRIPGVRTEPILWLMRPCSEIGYVAAAPIPRRSFVEHHQSGATLTGYQLQIQKRKRRVRYNSSQRFENQFRQQQRRLKRRRF